VDDSGIKNKKTCIWISPTCLNKYGRRSIQND